MLLQDKKNEQKKGRLQKKPKKKEKEKDKKKKEANETETKHSNSKKTKRITYLSAHLKIAKRGL